MEFFDYDELRCSMLHSLGELTKGNDAASGDATQKMSKNAKKKAAKRALNKKEKKEKPQWANAGEGKNKKKTQLKQVEWVNTTPKGQKKDLSGEMLDAYHPRVVEAAWQDWWEAAGYYTPDVPTALQTPPDKKFTIVIPPPNVTGSLHLGHALTTAIEDTLTRWHRMRGDVSIYIPGTDHAGIATQSVVEKKLKKDENLTRHDLGREEFVKRVWEWKEQYGGKICTQLRSLGTSTDWSREAFTMDDNLSRAVTEAFCRFHEDGLLYRDTRLVNWSCTLKSAISEIEVDYIDLPGKTYLPVPGHTKKDYKFGVIQSFAYPVEGGEGELVVATTRLETMLGDSAVAVHPDDPRYKHLHGKYLIHPFNQRRIPIICDPILVDMEFGTGAVKVTPAHDPNDYECGKRNNLEFITILAEDGKINKNGYPFEGWARYDVRIEMEKQMKEMGIYRGEENNAMRLGLCSRSNDIIEPLLTPQWYVNCTSMAAEACEKVRNGELKILPTFHEATWFRWLENIRDWCISRQLWWGHRIPAYFATRKDESGVDKNDQANKDRWVVARTKEEAKKLAAEKLGTSVDQVNLDQDEDVLDTWFSSGLFPFSVFGWPNNTEDLQAFYPTTLLETGMDILFFWVARMVMMGLHLTKTLPFSTVYLHAMVRDKYGRKMSKSLGNVIDPLEVINGCSLQTLIDKLHQGNLPEKEIKKAAAGQEEDFPHGIPECGADALRFGLLAYTVQGRDVNLDIQRLVGYRNFCNKLWNATKFAMMFITDLVPTADMADSLCDPSKFTLAPRDKWILSRLNTAIKDSEAALQAYEFAPLTTAIYAFWLYDLCDNYLELIKPVVNDESEANHQARQAAQATLYTCLDCGLRLLHPVMPFVTEELWQRLPGRGTMGEASSIMISPYPVAKPEWDNVSLEKNYEDIKEAIHAARSLRSDFGLTPKQSPDFFVTCKNDDLFKAISHQADDIKTLAKAASVTVLAGSEEPPAGCAVHIKSDQLQVHIMLKGLVNFEEEVAKLEKQLETKVAPAMERLRSKIEAPGYSKVPDKVKESNQQKMEQYIAEKENIFKAIENFKSFM